MKENRKKRRSKLFNLESDIIILSASDMITENSKHPHRSEKKALKNASSNLKDEAGSSVSSDFEDEDKHTTTEKITVGCAEECYKCDMSQQSWKGDFIPSKYCKGAVRSCLFPRNFSIWYLGIKK